jgi:Tfp pilus assembly protein PilF
MRAMLAALPFVLVLAALAAVPGPLPPPPPEAVALRNLGLAQLENERTGEAAETFRKLAKLTPGDPLAYADLAVAALRLQKSDEALAAITQALAITPNRPEVLAIQGDILQWSGKPEEALAAYRKAAMPVPERVEIEYGLYRLASQGSGPEAEAALKSSLQALARLRPENLVVLLQQGQRAIAAGDRAGATQAFLRVRELVGPSPPPAVASTLAPVLAALESADVSTARVPAIRLENVLKPTPAYQAGLHELTTGLLGNPIERFASEPPSSTFGDPVPVRFRAAPLAKGPVAGRALTAGDFDGDGKVDLAWIESGEKPRLRVLKGAGGDPMNGPEAAGITGLIAADLDNDGNLDLIAFGPKRLAFWRGKGEGTFEDATAGAGFGAAGAEAAAALDYDIEGDLDLAIGGSGVDLFRNALQGPLEAVGKQTFPPMPLSGVQALVASDLDRDGDLDLVVAHAQGIAWLDNLRQGHFADRTAASGLAAPGPVEALASADLDNDGLPDLIAAGNDGLTLWHNEPAGHLTAWNLPGLPKGKRFTSVLAFDADNDGRLDLAAAGPDGIVVLSQRGTIAKPTFEALPVEGAPGSATALVAVDLDGDGDLDLAAAGPSGLVRLENVGGNQNHWLDVRLRALATGNGKNNLQGIGSTLEVRAGIAYQFREAAVTPAHFGLGRLRQADLLRVVWTNGVPQNRLQPQIDQRIVEEQVLKGSCPFLYAWNGERFAFVTDLLWNSPVGLPVAPGVWAGADPHELVRVDGARPVDGIYRLKVTEELWEAAWFDAVRLWVVDHPAGVEVASSLKVIPGERQPVKVLAARDVRPVVAAWDGLGEDVTSRVRARDEVYASGFEPGPYQGVAKPWTFTFDLGESPGTSVRLLLDGWIFPADASLNLAAAQRTDYPYLPPRLEVETAKGWQTLIPSMGFPAGKTKTMVIDTPSLPSGAHRLRIVTSLWLGWDRIAWTRAKADEVPVFQARLDPRQANLHYRGFSKLIRRSPNGPHSYIYEESSTVSPWLPFPGRYTRYGDVRELLQTPDDRSVILAPGDEIALEFDATALPPVAPGWERTLFFESNGWDKDADRNTFEAQYMEPLPFRAMKNYGEPFPDTPEMREYRDRWLTRMLPSGRLRNIGGAEE